VWSVGSKFNNKMNGIKLLDKISEEKAE